MKQLEVLFVTGGLTRLFTSIQSLKPSCYLQTTELEMRLPEYVFYKRKLVRQMCLLLLVQTQCNPAML